MTINYTQSLAHGLEVLLLFDTSTPVLTVADISKRLGYSLSKSYRLTRTLIRYGLVEPADGTAKYCLGLNILRLGLLAKKRFTLPVIAQPLMKELSVRTKEAVLLTAVSVTKGICLERMESQESVRPSIFQPGELFHLHAGASAKVLMAYLPEKEWDKIIEKEGLRRFTAKTIVKADALKKELREIRKNGYAFSDGEVFGDVRAVGAPILDKKGNLVAGLSIVGPTYRFTKKKVKALSKLVVDCAAKISDEYAKRLEP